MYRCAVYYKYMYILIFQNNRTRKTRNLRYFNIYIHVCMLWILHHTTLCPQSLNGIFCCCWFINDLMLYERVQRHVEFFLLLFTWKITQLIQRYIHCTYPHFLKNILIPLCIWYYKCNWFLFTLLDYRARQTTDWQYTTSRFLLCRRGNKPILGVHI